MSAPAGERAIDLAGGMQNRPGGGWRGRPLLKLFHRVTVRFSEGPFFRRFIVPKVHCSEGSLFRKKGLLCRRFIGPKGHLSEIGVHCSEGSLFRRFIVPK